VLQDAGYAPVAEDASGTVVLQRPTARRAPAARLRPIRPLVDARAPDDAALSAAVAAMRRGEEVARKARRSPVTTGRVEGAGDGGTAAALAVLQQAAKDKDRVTLGYVDAYGSTAAKVVRPVSLGAGYLRAEDDRTDVLHTFALHRITSAALLADEEANDTV
jgi:predicted DNA-binding transcriptional regulator YafY